MYKAQCFRITFIALESLIISYHIIRIKKFCNLAALISKIVWDRALTNLE